MPGKRPPENPFSLQAHQDGLRPEIDDIKLKELVFELEAQRFLAKTGDHLAALAVDSRPSV